MWSLLHEQRAPNLSFAVIVQLTIFNFIVPQQLILMYAPCDDHLTNFLHLIHRSVGDRFLDHLNTNYTLPLRRKPVRHLRHNLSDACEWVLQDTVAVIAVSNKTEKWVEIDETAHSYNLPHLITSEFCHSCLKNPLLTSDPTLAEYAVFQFLREEYLSDVIIIYEEDSYDGSVLSVLLSSVSVRVSHIRATNHTGFLSTVEKYFRAWNMMDLSDDGRRLVSLGNSNSMDVLLKEMVESSMHKMRTKLLLVDDPTKWQRRLHRVTAYEVDLVVISTEPMKSKHCPYAIEVFSSNYETHADGSCRNLSSNFRDLGESVLTRVKSNLPQCCPEKQNDKYTIWKSFPSERGKQNLEPVAVWSNTLGLLRMETIDLKTRTLRIAVLKYPPYVVLNETEHGKTILGGCVFRDVLQFLSGRLNFEYELVHVHNNEWGSKIASNKWIGAIGMVTRGEADIIPYLVLTPIRREVIDFSIPVASVEYGILVAVPVEPPRAFIFLRPYKIEVWLILIVVAFFVSFVLCHIHRIGVRIVKQKNKKRGLWLFGNNFWLIFGAILQQSGVHLPQTSSARLVMTSWWLGMLVLMATYSANLIAFLAFPEAKWIVKSLNELADHKSIVLMVGEGSPILEDIKESDLTVFRKIREVYLGDPIRGIIINSGRRDVVDLVSAGKTVYVDDVNFLAKMVEDDYQDKGYCRVTVAPHTFSQMDTTLGLRRGSSLMPFINAEIQQMHESGVLGRWKTHHSPTRDECFSVETTLHARIDEVTLGDLQGAFYLLALGLLASLAFLSCEVGRDRLNRMLYYKRKRRINFISVAGK